MPGPYHIHRHQYHLAWDNRIAPVLRVASGSVFTVDCLDASNGQVTPSSTVADIAKFDMSLLDQVNGPVYVENALPGDVLEVEVLDISTAEWGWTAIIPNFGLLADEFPDPQLKIWHIDNVTGVCRFNDDISIPVRPFCGELGVARGQDGAFSTIPPYRTGGNLDTRHVTRGARLYLPVECEGALFSCGDGHAAQGDGEVCGTAIETPVTVTLRLTVRKNKALRDCVREGPHIRTAPEAVEPFTATGLAHTGTAAGAADTRAEAAGRSLTTTAASARPSRGYHVTTGVEASMELATRQAVRGMIRWLSLHFRLSREDAYMLCSVVVELKVACCVDMPNYVIGAYLPLDIFSQEALDRADQIDAEEAVAESTAK